MSSKRLKYFSSRHHKTGIINLLTLTFILVISSFVIATIQSRLLLSIYRGKSKFDSLTTMTAAESEMSDLLARVLSAKNYTIDYNALNRTLADGTQVSVTQNTTSSEQTLDIATQRSLSFSKIEAVRSFNTLGAINRLDIILSLDCTTSMNEPANYADPGGKTRIQAMKEAVLSFISDIANDPNHAKIFLGIDVFEINGLWMKATDGTNLLPTNDQARLTDAINAGLGATWNASTACKMPNLFGNTSVGTGYSFASDYYTANPPGAGTKRVEIVITDGDANSRIPHVKCPLTAYPGGVYCPYFRSFCTNPTALSYGWTCQESVINPPGNQCLPDVDGDIYCPQCKPHGFDFLECTVADTNTNWTSRVDGVTRKGMRDPTIDAYGVTILRTTDMAQETRDIFSNTNYIKQWYNDANANNLSSFLNSIFNDLTQQSTSIKIKKVTN